MKTNKIAVISLLQIACLKSIQSLFAKCLYTQSKLQNIQNAKYYFIVRTQRKHRAYLS